MPAHIPVPRVERPKNKTERAADGAGKSSSAAILLAAVARGGLQFMLIVWLQGIWLPLHGYDYAETLLWAGIYLQPLTIGFLVSGPLSGYLSDKFGALSTSIIMSSVPAAAHGSASGVRSTFQKVGTMLSMGLLFPPPDFAAFSTMGSVVVFALAIALSLVAAALSLIRGRQPRQATHESCDAGSSRLA
jgi:hypothetical protein